MFDNVKFASVLLVTLCGAREPREPAASVATSASIRPEVHVAVARALLPSPVWALSIPAPRLFSVV